MYWYFVVPDSTSCEEAFERVLTAARFVAKQTLN